MKSKVTTSPEEKNQKFVTVGIPAYHAQDHICDAIASISIQSIVPNVSIVIAKDDPKDDYEFVKTRYPELDIKIVGCDKNTGPGLARQRALDACTTPWITFMDADDVLINPLALEYLVKEIRPDVVEVQGAFMQEIQGHPQGIRLAQRNDIGHPWVFGRLYCVPFLKQMEIGFSELRAMEDGELNWKIRMSIEGTQYKIAVSENPIYMWRTGSEHSITRIGIEENNGEPLYNWDLCQVGATAAEINAIKFCKKKNPFNGSILKFTVEMMIEHYFTYIKCLNKKPIFASQNLFNAKRFYHSCYESVEKDISDDIIKTFYTQSLAHNSQDMIGIIPEITFFDFMKMLKDEPFGGKDEFDAIRSEYPSWVIELDKKSGVLGDEGYVFTIGEREEYEASKKSKAAEK